MPFPMTNLLTSCFLYKRPKQNGWADADVEISSCCIWHCSCGGEHCKGKVCEGCECFSTLHAPLTLMIFQQFGLVCICVMREVSFKQSVSASIEVNDTALSQQLVVG
ncbi:uncharacterized protein LOC125478386 [Pyrus x bretschneideri]|uniref:uncharacterized protein LOC125478386 n=1 Tax=Pyrus x bretschneideri TaxID=225117 RepID=UPI00202EE80B|nr:uncharacterized protein LOC125478386 [Pyrus x bretschneideri]